MASVEQRIAVLQNPKHEEEQKRKRLEHLEDDVDELAKEKSRLEEENLELTHKWESAQTSLYIIEDP